MQIVQKRLEELKEYENNPRNNAGAVEPVANSIREFGFKVPIVATAEGTIIAGHTRYKAAQLLKLETVPVVIADGLTADQIRAYRLADNKTAELAEWDWGLLADELAAIDESGMIDMGLFAINGAGEPDGREYKSVEIDVESIESGWDGTCPGCGYHFCETRQEETEEQEHDEL